MSQLSVTKMLYSFVLLQSFTLNGFPCPPLRSLSDHFLRTINKDFDEVCIAMTNLRIQWSFIFFSLSNVTQNTGDCGRFKS
jgi:hypothetical protein